MIYTVELPHRHTDAAGIRYAGPQGALAMAEHLGVSRQNIYLAASRDSPIAGCVFVEQNELGFWAAILPFGGELLPWVQAVPDLPSHFNVHAGQLPLHRQVRLLLFTYMKEPIDDDQDHEDAAV